MGLPAVRERRRADWLDELEAGGAEVVRGVLAKANDGYVEAPEGSAAAAAADITAACQGNPPATCRRTWTTPTNPVAAGMPRTAPVAERR